MLLYPGGGLVASAVASRGRVMEAGQDLNSSLGTGYTEAITLEPDLKQEVPSHKETLRRATTPGAPQTSPMRRS